MTPYSTLHSRLSRQRGRAKDQVCVACGNQAQEWAQIQDTDGESLDDYQAMCCSCHQKYDDHWNEKTKAKVGKSVSKRWKDPEYKARVGAAITKGKTGVKVSEEGRRNIAKSKVGNRYAAGKRTPEQCENIRRGRWGR